MLKPDQIARNREIIAERCKWPEGALNACLELEAQFPHLTASYSPSSPEEPWITYYTEQHHRIQRPLHATSPEKLREIMAALPTDNPYH